MAAVTNAFTATASSANVSSYASVSFTPTAGHLHVIFCQATDTVAASPTLTASANSMTYTLVLTATRNTSVHSQYLFVSDQFVPASPSAMTVTFDCTGDAATGLIMCGGTVSGMSKVGTAAIRQTAKEDNGAGGTTPAPTFAAACLTGNPTLVGLATTSATGTTQPSGWTEQVDTTYSTPTTGGGYVSRDSGFTGTTITWGSTSTQFCDIAVELDASVPAASIPFRRDPSRGLYMR